ncbi:hypothetical protein SDC9_67020 [bioreactor metagenome]|uniref:Uncharacterized protein n=1 Tax=bioreactor metagenome TaxID=1076179 RepID=A0A644XWW6_9ZZZZ
MAADHRRHLHQIVAVHLGQRDHRCAQRAEGHGRGVGDQRKARRRQRREAQTDQDRRRHRHRRAKARSAFKESAKAEGDQQQLDAAVFGNARERILQHLEATVLLGELMQKDDVQHNPADRQQAREATEQRRPPRHVGRHAVGKNRHHQRGDQPHACGDMRLDVKKPQRREHHHHGYCREQGGDHHVPDRIVDLLPNHLTCPFYKKASR